MPLLSKSCSTKRSSSSDPEIAAVNQAASGPDTPTLAIRLEADSTLKVCPAVGMKPPTTLTPRNPLSVAAPVTASLSKFTPPTPPAEKMSTLSVPVAVWQKSPSTVSTPAAALLSI